MEFEPIGTFYGEAQYKIQAPRQGTAQGGGGGIVRLYAGKNFDLALRDLAGFSHVWLLYVFHQNSTWKPLVRPPLPPAQGQRVGVFASRSPYRPNAIGMTCARLLSVEGLELVVEETDLLDGTPILDIKPYLSQWDSIPEATMGWVLAEQGNTWNLVFAVDFIVRAHWVKNLGGPDLERVARVQLSHQPLNGKRKRVRELAKGRWEFAFRTWRVEFSQPRENCLEVLGLYSGYGENDLAPESADPYGDKELHRQFMARWK